MININKETIETVTRKLIETPSPVGYYEQIQPVFAKLAKEYGYEVSYDRKRTAYMKVEGKDSSKTNVTYH